MTAITEAIAAEQEIAARAETLRGEATVLTPEMFLKLWPLLREPIPAGFLSTVPKQTGKPYDSTGIKSVQVQVTRMDNVLTPLWWNDEVEYHDEGRLARVTVRVPGLVSRQAWGGVDRGSTRGNIYKGSYTNAAKMAFARVGPGWEVYLGATDLDPDVNAQAARAAAKAPARARETPERETNERLLTQDELAKLTAMIEQAGRDVEIVLGSIGVEATEHLTNVNAFEIYDLLGIAPKATAKAPARRRRST
jgi:hypothetical protein